MRALLVQRHWGQRGLNLQEEGRRLSAAEGLVPGEAGAEGRTQFLRGERQSRRRGCD